MLDFGWQVETTDSAVAGTVMGAAYDAESLDLTAVVVRRGAMATRDIVVPAESVNAITDGLVSLSLTVDELESLEDFRLQRAVVPGRDFEPAESTVPVDEDATEVVAPRLLAPAPTTAVPVAPVTVVETVGNVPEGSYAFSAGQEVLSSDGDLLGVVSHLRYEGERLSELVVDTEGVFGAGKLVPIDLCQEVAVDELLLSVDRAGYDALPDAPVV
ncbi:MAG: hypothetical protein M3Q29_13490 [Chloroflexota bacterium]|nr:hypothetical protein [Chloroflexota bacterium]